MLAQVEKKNHKKILYLSPGRVIKIYVRQFTQPSTPGLIQLFSNNRNNNNNQKTI